MRNSLLGIAASLVLIGGAWGAQAAAGLDRSVLDEINFARSHPFQYAVRLRQSLAGEHAGARYASVTDADPDAVDDALAFLARQPPLAPLSQDDRLAASAQDHIRAQGPTGEIGHDEAGGVSFGARLKRHGVWAGLSAENISYGYDKAPDVVRQLIIDSGIASRAHRKNIFDPTLSLAGVSCGAQSAYGAMCVIDFAGALAPSH